MARGRNGYPNGILNVSSGAAPKLGTPMGAHARARKACVKAREKRGLWNMREKYRENVVKNIVEIAWLNREKIMKYREN